MIAHGALCTGRGPHWAVMMRLRRCIIRPTARRYVRSSLRILLVSAKEHLRYT